MTFSFARVADDDLQQWFAAGLREVMEARGHDFVEDPDDAGLVINFFPETRPRPYRRRAKAVYLVGVASLQNPLRQPIQQVYPLLIRSLSNLLIALDFAEGGKDAHFLTLEQGHYVVTRRDGDRAFFEQIYQRVEPLATSRLVIDNVFVPDLPEALWHGDEVTASITAAGRRLDELDLLPAPFPIREVLGEREFRHVERLYGLGGLSYGNVSARKDETRFWMSASGVDKSRLVEVGKDILLVTGYDEDANAMRLSVPPDIKPSRVSVDAIEHWMIYQEHPSVGAILHVHAWLDDARATEINYPCGTYELGKVVADIVREAPDPARAVVGLKNHGLTITGLSLDEIFERVGHRLLRQVPMS
jgi:ribulose-5-phosphate 4-epimerase/fuculose-1-phosphate aldolase